MGQIFLETRMFRLSDGEEIMTLAFFVLKPDASESADRQTDTDTRVTEDTRHDGQPAISPEPSYPACTRGSQLLAGYTVSQPAILPIPS